MHRLAAIILLGALPLCAQTNRGSITGTVTDPSAAVVPGATITITNLGTSAVRKLTTAENGTFNAQDLEPVTYRVVVEASGFAKSVVDAVKVDTASVATVNVKLRPGSVDTQVTVDAEA